jgi:hypothetical protein
MNKFVIAIVVALALLAVVVRADSIDSAEVCSCFEFISLIFCCLMLILDFVRRSPRVTMTSRPRFRPSLLAPTS